MLGRGGWWERGRKFEHWGRGGAGEQFEGLRQERNLKVWGAGGRENAH